MKRFISIVLALVLAFSGAITAFAAAKAQAPQESAAPEVPEAPEAVADYDGYPFLLVRGMSFDGLYYKLGTDEERRCFSGVDAKELIGVIFKFIGVSLINWDLNKGVDVVIEYVNRIMGLIACGKNGESKYDVSVEEYPLSLDNYPELWDAGDGNEMGILKTAVESYGAKNTYYFNYDWRLDPYVNAAKINTMVNQALADTGKDKINLVCASMGGVETISYMYKYGCEKLNKVVFISSTICGAYVATDLLQGKAVVDDTALYNFLVQAAGADNRALGVLLKGLKAVGAFKGVSKLADVIFPKIIDKVYDDFLRDTFATMPVLWSLVEPDSYDACIKFMFEGVEGEYAEIIRLCGEYRTMALQREAMLDSAVQSGMKICIVANYNSANIPIYERSGENGDGTLETALMLGGARVAPLGKTLGDDYISENPAYVSPDRVIDMAPALYPDYTWAVKSAPHVATSYGTDYSDFIFWLVDCDGQPTVNTNPSYPQYMLSSKAQELKPF